MHTAREVCPRVDVHCVYLDDVPALRSLFSRLLKVDLESDSAPDAPSDEGRTSAWLDFLDVSLRMHRAIKSVFPTIAPGHHRDAFRDCANDFRVHLRKQRQLAQEFRRTN
jgi:hypothetical protein